MQTVEIAVPLPEEMLTALKQSKIGERSAAEQVRIALAIHLFQQGSLSLVKAATMAGMHRIPFELLLAEMGIPAFRHETEAILEGREAYRRALQR